MRLRDEMMRPLPCSARPEHGVAWRGEVHMVESRVRNRFPVRYIGAPV